MKQKTKIKKTTRLSEIMLTCRMPKETFERINKAAHFAALSRSEFVRFVIESHLKRQNHI